MTVNRPIHIFMIMVLPMNSKKMHSVTNIQKFDLMSVLDILAMDVHPHVSYIYQTTGGGLKRGGLPYI